MRGLRPLRALPAITAFIPLVFLVVASCSSWPTAGRTRTVFGRIVSTPTVEVWLGHVTAEDEIYEVALEPSGHALIGLMIRRTDGCPYNGRPREQLFRIEYAVSGGEAVLGGVDHASLPRHLMTRHFVLRCDPVGEPRPGPPSSRR